MVDGKNIICSDQEETQIRKFWSFNESYPEYIDCNRYDGASDPIIDMTRAKELHLENLQKVIHQKTTVINQQIETADEENDGKSKAALLKQRKDLKAINSVDMTKFNTVADLKAHLEQVKAL